MPFVIFKPHKSANKSASILLLSYLNALIPVQSNNFRSVTWGPLIDKLQLSPKNVLHLYIPVNKTQFKSTWESAKFISDLDKKCSDSTSHVSITSYLSFRVIYNAICDYYRHFELP